MSQYSQWGGTLPPDYQPPFLPPHWTDPLPPAGQAAVCFCGYPLDRDRTLQWPGLNPLSCGHTFHAICLQQLSNAGRAPDLPWLMCPGCQVDTDGSTTSAPKRLHTATAPRTGAAGAATSTRGASSAGAGRPHVATQRQAGPAPSAAVPGATLVAPQAAAPPRPIQRWRSPRART